MLTVTGHPGTEFVEETRAGMYWCNYHKQRIVPVEIAKDGDKIPQLACPLCFEEEYMGEIVTAVPTKVEGTCTSKDCSYPATIECPVCKLPFCASCTDFDNVCYTCLGVGEIDLDTEDSDSADALQEGVVVPIRDEDIPIYIAEGAIG
jgi:hypothetical protein